MEWPKIREVWSLISRVRPKLRDVTIVTQCSMDRLAHLEEQANCWSGPISAVVYVPHPTNAVYKELKTMHTRVAQRAECQLNIIAATNQQARNCDVEETRYPINSLRNMALMKAQTEVVALLDVDLLPCVRLSESLVGDIDLCQSIVRSCCENRTAYVLPAFEPTAQAGSMTEAYNVTRDSVKGGRMVVAEKFLDEQLACFASSVFPQGHGPTDHEKWLKSFTAFTVDYEEGFEPYILCSRRLVPWYDERFVGYGKNKVIHIFHLACLGFKFVVQPNWYSVSLPHPPSSSWREALGPDRIPGLFHKTKLLYERAKLEIRNGFTPDAGRSALLHKTDFVCCNMGEWCQRDVPQNIHQTSPVYLQSICELRLQHQARALCPIMTLPSPRQPGNDEITLVTTCTPDRLSRLESIIKAWNGPLCVSVYYRRWIGCRFTSCAHLESKLKNLHSTLCRTEKLVDISLVVDDGLQAKETLVNASNNEVEDEEFERQNRAQSPNGETILKKQARRRSSFVPINSMRNVALELARTDLVFLLDVDLLPCSGLHEELKSCLQRMRGHLETTVFVVPAFELKAGEVCNESAHLQIVTPVSETSNCIASTKGPPVEQANIAPGNTIPLLHTDSFPSDTFRGRNWFEVIKDALFNKRGWRSSSLEPFLHESICYVQSLASQGIGSMLPLVASRKAIPFHSEKYPVGHCPTDTSKWLESTVNKAGCYNVDYVEGYEPFIVASKRVLPRFEEKFSGYGYDKVSFCLNLHMLGFTFCVVPGVFTIDMPHKRSRDWLLTFGPHAAKLQAKKVQGLYSRFRRMLVLKHSSWPCPAAETQNLWPGALPTLPPQLQSDVFTKGCSLVWHDNFVLESGLEKRTFNPPSESKLLWRASGWQLSAKQGLRNCELTTTTLIDKLPASDWGHMPEVALGVFLPRGTWSPSGCLSCGLPVGGVAARHRLTRGLSSAVLKYMVYFQKGFCWGLGGTLPGLYCNGGQGIRISLGWRQNGTGTVLITNPSNHGVPRNNTEHDIYKVPTSLVSKRSAQWFFTAGQWHSVQIYLHLKNVDFTDDSAHSCYTLKSKEWIGSTKVWFDRQLVHDRNYSLMPMDDGVKANLKGPARYGLCSHLNTTASSYNHTVDGVLLTCFYGGSTKEWAAPQDAKVYLSSFEIWSKKSGSCIESES